MPDASSPPLNSVAPVVITSQPNGPLLVRGAVVVDGQTRMACALCRCGLSAKKPFCDNAHKKANWQDGTTPPPVPAPVTP